MRIFKAYKTNDTTQFFYPHPPPLSHTKKKKGSHTNNKVTAIEHFLVSVFVIRAIQYLLVICRILEEYMSGTKIDIGQQIPVNNSRKT